MQSNRVFAQINIFLYFLKNNENVGLNKSAIGLQVNQLAETNRRPMNVRQGLQELFQGFKMDFKNGFKKSFKNGFKKGFNQFVHVSEARGSFM